jgi:transcriptional regulator
MLVQPWDASTDPDEWRAFIVATGFGHLVATGRGRDVAVVVPTQFVLDGDEVVLHLARANPVWAAIDENPAVLLSVAGDWAYIPTSWKVVGDEDPARGIPTTYYAAVQLTGTATVVDDPDELAGVLRTQLGTFEPDGGYVDPTEHQRRFAAIRGLRIPIEAVTAKFKYGGNVDAEHRLAVADRLDGRSGPGDEAARAHLLRRLGSGPPPGR